MTRLDVTATVDAFCDLSHGQQVDALHDLDLRLPGFRTMVKEVFDLLDECDLEYDDGLPGERSDD